MSASQPSKPARRNYASIGHYYPEAGPPVAEILEDEHGLVVHTSPFGHDGPQLAMSLERWHELKMIIGNAIDQHSASRYAARLSGAVGL